MQAMPEEWDWEQLHENYNKLVYKVAIRLQKQYDYSHQIDTDELVSEIWVSLMRKGWKHDPDKASLSTWIYQIAYFTLKSYFRDKFKKAKTLQQSSLDEMEYEPEASDPKGWIYTLLDELSEEAQTLVHVVIEAPEELSEVLSHTAPVKSRKALDSYMVDALDWNWRKLERVRSEITEQLV